MSAEMESPTCGKPHGPQNSNGVLSKARLCIANEPYFFFDVINAADEIDDLSAGRIVVERVDGEISAKRVFLQCAKSTVAQNHAAVIMDDFVGDGLAEGRYFDQITAKSHMHDRKASAHDARAAEQFADGLWGASVATSKSLGFTAQRASRTQPPTK